MERGGPVQALLELQLGRKNRVAVREPDITPLENGPECRDDRLDRARAVGERTIVEPVQSFDSLQSLRRLISSCGYREHPGLGDEKRQVGLQHLSWKTPEPAENGR